MTTRYPIYVISKGRWDTRFTSKSLEAMETAYRIVVEPQERDAYAAVIDPAKILTLPFSNLGQGGIPARNWVWNHSIQEGHDRHWIMDDNIQGFWRFNHNAKPKAVTDSIFRAMEDFVDRYENVAMAGPNYKAFAPPRSRKPPCTFNTRIYSCILIDNAVPFRWRGRYNEDTDLSLRCLKSGLCTVLFNAFLAEKGQTMTVKGGNTDELYQGDGRLKMAQSLQQQHPDVTRIAWKWGRWQHQVDYRPFRGNRLRLRPGVVIPEGNNEYGMRLVQRERS